MFLGIKLAILAPALIALVALRFLRANILVWGLGTWCAIWVVLKFGFAVPLPRSVIMIYMSIVSLSILAYAASSRERWAAFSGPILRLITEPRYRLVLAALVVIIPVAAAWQVYARMKVPLEAPGFGRTVHPAPPDSITVHDNEINLIIADNPYRHLEQDDPDAFAEHMANGRRVYFQNCFYCHGDFMGGDGMFSHGLNPIPTNFTDAGILPQFQESFLFWRVSKGGPGMPEEGGPWDSAMPAWENFLTEEEMWDVVAYLYDFTDWRPRAQEVHH